MAIVICIGVIALVVIVYLLSLRRKKKKFKDALSRYVQYSSFSGTVMIKKRNRKFFEFSAGFTNYEKKIQNKSDTIYQIGSTAKTFTALVILQLIEKQQLNEEDLISNYIGSFSKFPDLTIHHLLCNSSGLVDYITDNINGLEYVNDEQIVETIILKSLQIEPGKHFSYSNSNWFLLAVIAEKITGRTFDVLLEDMIFKPFKMENSSFYLPKNDHIVAQGYVIGESLQKANSANPLVFKGAGMLYSTVSDLAIFYNSLFSSMPMVSEEIVRKLTTKHVVVRDGQYYGYGIFIEDMDKDLIYSHSGGVYGFNSQVSFLKNQEITIVSLANNELFNSLNLVETLIRMLLNLPFDLPTGQNYIKIPIETLEMYEGVYDLEYMGRKTPATVKLKGDDLFLSIPMLRTVKLGALGENRFHTLLKGQVFIEFDTELEEAKFNWEGLDMKTKRIKT